MNTIGRTIRWIIVDAKAILMSALYCLFRCFISLDPEMRWKMFYICINSIWRILSAIHFTLLRGFPRFLFTFLFFVCASAGRCDIYTVWKPFAFWSERVFLDAWKVFCFYTIIFRSAASFERWNTPKAMEFIVCSVLKLEMFVREIWFPAWIAFSSPLSRRFNACLLLTTEFWIRF